MTNTDRSVYHKEYYKLNKEKIRLRTQLYYQNNKELINKRTKEYVKNNKEKRRLCVKKWSDSHKDDVIQYRKEHKNEAKEYQKEYRKNHKAEHNHRNANRRAIKRNATVSYANLEKIKKYYVVAEILSHFMPEKYHVDHIIPLQSELVCGLHHEDNLRVITATDNIRKGNKFKSIII
jgi:hypothetical protein